MGEDLKYKRILLKLSGEALLGTQQFGIDHNPLEMIANEVKQAYDLGAEIAIVVGGGNIFRGVKNSAKYGMDQATGDYIGMLATVMNALALQSALRKLDVHCRVQSAIDMDKIAEPYIQRKAIRHLEKGRVVIFGCGTGNPYFSTDTTAALRAAEINADIILLAKKVDGVYDSDPNINKNAKKFDSLKYIDVLNRGLGVMDSTATSLCMDNNIPIRVFGLDVPSNILDAVMGKEIGTLVD